MKKNKMPRLMFAAAGSGSGKTTVTCAVIELMKRKNLKVASFKCGPDYIDPMFHRSVLGISSGNLDTFFTDRHLTRYLLAKGAGDADITVLEGVMGYYDGLGGQSEQASSYEIARVTETPVILVVDAKGASVSLAAVIRGIMEYRKDSRIRGVILNRVSPSYYERIKAVIEKECGVKVFGCLPQSEKIRVPSRHLGLIAPGEMDDFHQWIQAVADEAEKTFDINSLLEAAGEAEFISEREPDIPCLPCEVTIAVAKDEAFSFFYAENLKLLEKMGARLVEFSPIHDKALPTDIDGLLLLGGYPENYAKELEEAVSMRESVRLACQDKLPCLAECGGFLYLQRELTGSDGVKRKMAGALAGSAERANGRRRFGYVLAENRTCGVLGDKGQVIRGHEFHRWDCSENGEDFLVQKPLLKEQGDRYPAMVHNSHMAAGFLHFYYYSNPEMIYRFLLSCARYRAGRRAKERWDAIAKPIDSLGILEDYVGKLCRIAADERPYDLRRRALVVFCGDHGVVGEGVTQTGSEVTRIVSENFAKGCSTVNYMAKSAGADVFTIDMGIDAPPYPTKELRCGAVIDRKVARGTDSLFLGPAMTGEQCVKAVETGKNLVGELKAMGYRILATGEMGIGNTTCTSVLAAALLNLEADEVTGKGAGLSAQGIKKKRLVVGRAVDRIRQKHLSDPMDILAEAGGYEVAGMVGAFLGAVAHEIPIVIDGAISSVAALVAAKIDPRVVDFALASHVSEEITGRLALRELGLEAALHTRMCLGEGTGAVALFPLLDMAVEVYGSMGTFSEYEIDPYARFTAQE